MAVTTAADIKTLNGMGQAAVGIAFDSVPLLELPGLAIDVSDRIDAGSGDKIDFNVWKTDVDEVVQDDVRNSREGVTPSKFTLDRYTEDAVSKIISFDLDFYLTDDSPESIKAHHAQIVGEKFGAYLQAKLLAQAVEPYNAGTDSGGTPLVHDVGTEKGFGMTVDAILDARLKWGDKAGLFTPVCFMRTRQYTQLAKSADYKTLAAGGMTTLVKANSAYGNGTRWIATVVHGVPIVLCDSLPYTPAAAETPAFDTALMIGPGAFGVYANGVRVKTVDHAGSAVQTMDAHYRVATTLFRHNPRRVVKIVTAAEE